MVNQRLNSQITPRSIFFSAEPRNAHSFSIYHYLHRPSPLRERYAAVLRDSVFVGARDIVQVSGPTNIPQITKTIIRAVAVYVVNMAFRPFTRHIEPCKPMFSDVFFTNKYPPVSVAHVGAGPCPYSVGLVFAAFPCKKPCVRVIMDIFTQFFYGNWHNTSVSVLPFCNGGNRNGNLFSGATLAAKRSV